MSKAAIVVGIDAYQDRPLAGCVNDAESMATILEMPEYAYDVVQLLDERATRPSVLRAIREVGATAPEQLLIYFAGHGAATDFGTYLVTVDGSSDDPGIEVNEFGRLLEGVSKTVAEVVVVLDCCHSGGASTWATSRPIQADDLRKISTKRDARVLLAACRPEQLAYETRASPIQGEFTKTIIDGLAGEARDFSGSVTVAGLWDHVVRSFPLAEEKQLVTFRGDMTGVVALGHGLPKREGPPIEAERRAHLVRRARELLNSFEADFMHNDVVRSNWNTDGFLRACVEFREVEKYITSVVRENAEIAHDPEFRIVLDRTANTRSALGGIYTGLETPLGMVGEKIGAGGFGSVWKLHKGDIVEALKVYHPEDLNESSKVRIFRQGFDAMRRLRHPRIVKVSEISSVPYAFAMEYIDGSNFKDLVGAIDDPAARIQVLIQIAETIEHAHAHEVAHRDIKPENIILRYDEKHDVYVPHLTDFDLAWFPTAKTMTRAMGSIFYAAPEQLAKPRSEEAKDYLVDIYAFGRLAQFAVTASHPVPLELANNDRAVRQAVGKWPNGQAAGQFAELVSACSQYSPKDRPQSMTAVIAKLEEILQELRSTGKVLTPSSFREELAFSYSGVADFESTERATFFQSLTGRSAIELEVIRAKGGTKCRITLNAEELRLNSMASGTVARQALNTRLDHALRQFEGAERFAGQQGAYQVFVEVSLNSLGPDDLARCSSVLRTTIRTVEGM